MDMRDMQDKVGKFVETNKLDAKLEFRFLDLISEMGEVAKEFLKTSGYGKNSVARNKEVESEMGDVFYSLIVLANKLGVDLEKSLNLAFKKYQTRLKKGSAGSEVDET